MAESKHSIIKKGIVFIFGNELGINILTCCLMPIHFIGRIFYYLSKIIRAIGFILMFSPGSSKEELKDFFSISYSLRDL